MIYPEALYDFLEDRYAYYEANFSITLDPISIPYGFSNKMDIEISGFFAAMLAWGNRKSILKSCNRLMELMDDAPHQFITQHHDKDLKPLMGFVYRTFNSTDLLYFIAFLKHHYQYYTSLEDAFLYPKLSNVPFDMKLALSHFHDYFFSLEFAPDRTRKHVSTPLKKSACKRLNMFMRWMVRVDSLVDFGIWKRISPKDLICPLDVHVGTTSRRLSLLGRVKDDWLAAEELTNALKQFDFNDPVKYDLVLFSLGVEQVPF